MKVLRRRKDRSTTRTGVVLIIVLVAVALLSLGAFTFAEMMRTEYEAVLLSGRQTQSRALVDSAVASVQVMLLQDKPTLRDMGGIYDNPTAFQGIVVANDEDPSFRGNFTVLAPALDDYGVTGGVRYGLEDESSRLNLNTLLQAEETQEGAGRQLLMALPGMTEQIADSILDWLDADTEPREFGAESEYYTQLQPTPYDAKNGPLDTVEELLLVKDVTPQLLFGIDDNRNGVIDEHEAASGVLIPGDPGDGSLSRGWASMLTLHSAEANRNELGEPRIYVNGDDLQLLYDQLVEKFDEAVATFIVAYRQNGKYTGSREVDEGASGTLDLTGTGRRKIGSVLDLIGTKVRVTFEDADDRVTLGSPFKGGPGMLVSLPMVMDNLTVSDAPSIPGRININQAPRTVMLGIPGMEEELVDQIISARANFDPNVDDPNHRHETWLLTDGILLNETGQPDMELMQTLMPFITAGGDVYRFQAVGYFQDGGASTRVETIIDSTGAAPRILFWRDISHLGRGYPLEILGVQATVE